MAFLDDADLDKYATKQIYGQLLGGNKDKPLYKLLLHKVMSEQGEPSFMDDLSSPFDESDLFNIRPSNDSNYIDTLRIPRLIRA